MSTPETYNIDTLSYDLRRLSNAISDIDLYLDDDSVDAGKRLSVARYAVQQALTDLTGLQVRIDRLLDDVRLTGEPWANACRRSGRALSTPAANELAADPDGRCHCHATPAANDADVDEVDARREA